MRFANTGRSAVVQTTPAKALVSRGESKREERKLVTPEAQETDEDEEDEFEEVIPYKSAITMRSAPALASTRITSIEAQPGKVSHRAEPPTTPRPAEPMRPKGIDELEVMSDNEDSWSPQATPGPGVEGTERDRRQHEEESR